MPLQLPEHVLVCAAQDDARARLAQAQFGFSQARAAATEQQPSGDGGGAARVTQRATDQQRPLLAQRLDSVGGGLRVSFPNRLVLDVGYAKPLDRALRLDKERPPARVLVSLTVQFRDRAR